MSKNPTKEEIAKMPENNFPERLKKVRLQAGITIESLSEKTGISEKQIKRYIKGECEPTMHALEELSEALRVSIEFLVNGSSELLLLFEIQKIIEACPEEQLPALQQMIEIFIKSHIDKGDK